MIRVICDVISRITIVGSWIYTANSGIFSTLMATGFFYTFVILNFIENLAFSIYKREDIASSRNLTGE